MSDESALLAEIERLRGVIARNKAGYQTLRDEVIRLRAENAVLRERRAPATESAPAYEDAAANLLRALRGAR